MDHIYDSIIVGGGAAGVGTGRVMQRAGLDFLIVEKGQIGSSFRLWSSQTRFISPSFTGNSFGCTDLNAIDPETSPAFLTQSEHPTGNEYADYLAAIAEHFQLPIREQTIVKGLEKSNGVFTLTTSQGTLRSRTVVWATGEFQYPDLTLYSGMELTRHSSTIGDYRDLDATEYVIIGGYESGFDLALYLVAQGKKVTILDGSKTWEKESSDASLVLSPYTHDRYRALTAEQHKRLKLVPNNVNHVTKKGLIYTITLDSGVKIKTPTQPISATGFAGGECMIGEYFVWDTNRPILNEQDESTTTPGLYLVGPHVKHGPAIFCFIYKYRQRFAVVVESICSIYRKDSPTDWLEYYQKNNFYLKDLGGCCNDCAC